MATTTATTTATPTTTWATIKTVDIFQAQKIEGNRVSKSGRVTSQTAHDYRVIVTGGLVVWTGETEERALAHVDHLVEALAVFQRIGIVPAKARETVRNPELTECLFGLLTELKLTGGCDKSLGVLLYNLASAKLPAHTHIHRPLIARYIADHKMNLQPQLDAAIKLLTRIDPSGCIVGGGILGERFDATVLERECGIGVDVSPAVVKSEVARAFAAVREEVTTKRYQFDVFAFLRNVRAGQLKWADGKTVKDEVDAQLLAILGPKTESDIAAGKGKNKAPTKESPSVVTTTAAPTATATATTSATVTETSPTPPGPRPPEPMHHGLSLPSDNKQLNPAILAAHLARTGGKVVTRFPPEPNGFLHIGHAKSMFLNFGTAEKYGGKCFLRYDDTNPEKENHTYIESILDNVKWLGHTPCAITYASSYFDQLIECAIALIKRGKAYVCHQSPAEIKESRLKCIASPWRDRPIQESLDLFEQMRQGRFKEGEATLRMKMTVDSPNPCMRDLIAYRIKYVPHPMTGNKYCVYPSYDYTHCINDSLEDITHSMCTLEFLPRRESYFWLLDALEMYKPVVWEFSRLNITHTVMSKRKLLILVTKKLVNGWDDPRLPTINGLRRKGYSPTAINNFCDAVGVTTNDTVWIHYTFLETHCRQDMENRCLRGMAVLDPLRVEIVNWEADRVEMVSRPNHPSDESRGRNEVPFSRVIYIERADFSEKDVKSFWGLAVGKEVGLRHSKHNITCTGVVRDTTGKIVSLTATYDPTHARTPKGHIHWVAQPRPNEEPCTAEVRLYDVLFKSKQPDALKDWENDINPNSLIVIPNAYIDESLKAAKPWDCFQFERVGFFCTDLDSKPGKPVFNRTVKLVESKKKPKF